MARLLVLQILLCSALIGLGLSQRQYRGYKYGGSRRAYELTKSGDSSSSSQSLNNHLQEPPVLPPGPNVCSSRGYRNHCCPGWTAKARLCIIPICTRSCGAGRCIRPNLCMCDAGGVSPNCGGNGSGGGNGGSGNGNGGLGGNGRPGGGNGRPGGGNGRPGGGNGNGHYGGNGVPPHYQRCTISCMNGGTCDGNRCICPPGYVGSHCGEPVCTQPCLNGGKCIGPDRCSCVYGFVGKRCETDFRTGPCFTKPPSPSGICQGQLGGMVCTKQLCCATIGKAWGHPCEECPDDLPCESGFLKNIHSRQCVDIDECEAIPSLCVGGTCENTIGSFQCVCPEGQSRDPETNQCKKTDECKQEGVCKNGKCVDTAKGFNCICNKGYIAAQDQKSCIDTRQGNCYTELRSGRCKNALQMKLNKQDCCCSALGRGWGDTRRCEECPLAGTDPYDELCATQNPYWRNECLLRPDICGEGGECEDSQDGYICRCKPGFQLGPRKKCEDINECDGSKCHGGHCANNPGSYQCICPRGFDPSSDGSSCIDHDECQETGMCANGICTNMDGSYHCKCHDGFILSSYGHACTDVDECFENQRICLNGRCENTPGSYICRCSNGYKPTREGGFCVDMDECGDTGMCANGKCHNMDGSFKCICDPGYTLSPDGHSCIDNNECRNRPCTNGVCENNEGSFRCLCEEGFTLGADGRTCLDTKRDLCFSAYREGQCLNPSTTAVTKSSCCCCTVVLGQPMGWGTPCQPCPMPGSNEFDKLCPHGSGMNFHGDDINECAQNPSICKNGACENLSGTYRCICHEGFQEDVTGKLCMDINECAVDNLRCDGGQCRNTPGSFQCICPLGTQYNTETQMCEDINECIELGVEACVGGECQNSKGSFTCECPRGYKLDSSGRICIDDRDGKCWTEIRNGMCENDLPRTTKKFECCCSVGLAWGSPCEKCDRSVCDCPNGYAKLDGQTCTDINECDMNPGICKGGGMCVNTEGSYTCNCPPGLTLGPSGNICIDQRQEECFTQYHRGVCSNALSGLHKKNMCCCTVGKAWGTRCEPCPAIGSKVFQELCPRDSGFEGGKDVNECLMYPEMCENGRCRNTMGSYTCKCNQGYALDKDGIRCVDIDECNIMHGVCGNGTCRNTPGHFMCECDTGFESNMMMQVCMDIDECRRNYGLCRGGRCINTPGSYKCECPPGHELTSDGKACKDVDECSQTSGICSNGVCENMMGTYQCTCDNGYQQSRDGSHCQDSDECGYNNGGCSDLCINTPGSYTCSCRAGFMLIDGRRCVDVDECVDDPNSCNGGKCDNTMGSRVCTCEDGLVTGPDGQSCQDVDECRMNPNVCQNGECENTHGSFQCECEDGYGVKNGNTGCTDVDECAEGAFECDHNAECTNTQGGYECKCGDGFTGDGAFCLDINECLTNNGGCSQDALCINTEGSFKCVCDTGFRGDGFLCEDKDECSDNPVLCENGQCINHPGGFSCHCDMGFMVPVESDEQEECVDIDECHMFNNLCVFGKCENVFGMFRCICDEGYTIDNTGGNCTDVDECENPASCQFGSCVNTLGSYLCQCPAGYDLIPSGTGCIDKRMEECYLEASLLPSGRHRCNKGLGDPVTRATCCCSVGVAWSRQCELCPAPDSEEYLKLCPGGPGFRPNSITVVLEDINECLEIEHICVNGRCANTFGSFMCTCDDGYELDDTHATCVDKNECRDRSICGIGQCVNTEGSYECICPEGYMLLPNKRDCVDMRREPCYMGFYNNTCSKPMRRDQTKMLCCCSMGKAWGLDCEECPFPGTHGYKQLCGSNVPNGKIEDPITNEVIEMDECALMPTMCFHGRCINTPGSFFCECDRGFAYDEDGHTCVDLDECNKYPPPCEHDAQCINEQGSYRCECSKGYRLTPSGFACTDVDECMERPGICNNGRCTNYQGSFQCICNNGFALTPDGETCIDIDECRRSSSVCGNGTCMNTMGSYHCNCYDGFKIGHNGDCIDKDECRMLLGMCRNGRCRNLMGSVTCDCADGYTLTHDGMNCRDIDECTENGGYCPHPGECQNVMGSYMCHCPSGYKIGPDKRTCIDVDECVDFEDVCDGGECTNENGGFQCECPEGWRLSDDNMKCIDIRQEHCYDEFHEEQGCKSPRRNFITRMDCCCTMGAAWGSYLCERCPAKGTAEFTKLCPKGPGMDGNGHDIDECGMDNPCEGGGVCVNMDGSYRCECPEGFKLDETMHNCVDKDECREDGNMCGNGVCSNVNGGFECACEDGFAPGPLQVCEDIDECSELGLQCAYRCHNVPGSFRCTCPFGYALAPDGRHCQDLDECATPAADCKFACKNLIGSYMCICPDGFEQVDKRDDCRDVDECARNPGVCENGRCLNTRGGYRCDCHEGFERNQDGTECIDQRTGYCFQTVHCRSHISTLMEVKKGECCCTLGRAWGPRCETCPTRGSDEYEKLCMGPGFTVDGRDMDECSIMAGLCKNGRCINTLGSYKCMCNRGYKADHRGTRCIDVNECQQSPPPCKYQCLNTEGSYTCSCPVGYVLNPDGTTCSDMDECSSGRHMCKHSCINTDGSYRCGCQEGYTMHGDQCIDINECLEQSGLCQPGGTCVNTPGGFHCICPRGYQPDPSGTMCVDTDECLDDVHCSDDCQNMPGSYRCGCPDGFSQHPFWNQCTDKNECTDQPCGSSSCLNTLGGYQCTCPMGYQFDGQLLICIQAGGGCAGSGCVFGCTPYSGSSYACTCPSGYQPIGQGHCLSTINPPTYNGYGDVGGDLEVPTYPLNGQFGGHVSGQVNGHFNGQFGGNGNGNGQYLNGQYGGASNGGGSYGHLPQQSSDNYVSTEGCFSCKVNGPAGRRKRAIMESKYNSSKPFAWVRDENMTKESYEKQKQENHMVEDEITGPIVLRLALKQTRHRKRIIKLQSSVSQLKDNMVYEIISGNEGGIFELKTVRGIVELHFKHRLKHPQTFDLEIIGKPLKEDDSVKQVLHHPFSMSLRLVVTH